MGLKAAADGVEKLAEKTAKLREESDKLTTSLQNQAAAAEKARSASAEALSLAQRASVEIQKLGDGVQGVALSIDMAGQALKGMAVAVGQVQEQISKGNKDVQDLLKQIDEVAHDTKAEGYINGLVNKFKEGQIDAEQLRQMLAELLRGLSVVNAQGSGFLGDLQKQGLDLEALIQRLKDEMSSAKNGTSQDAPSPGGAGPNEALSDGGSGFSGGGAKRLVATAIDLGSGRPTASNAAQRARILHQLAQNTRNTRR